MGKPTKEHDLIFDEPISRWDEALPLGNGLTGLLIWGDGNPLRFSLDRGDLWDNRVAEETLAENFTYAELIKLVKQGKYDEVKERFEEFYRKPTPTKIPAGRIEFDYGRACGAAKSRLRLADVVGETTLEFGDARSEVTAFVHATEPLGCISISGAVPAVGVVAPDYSGANDFGVRDASPAGSLTLLGYPAAEIGRDGALSWFLQKTCEELEYAVVIAQKPTETGLDIIYTIATNADGKTPPQPSPKGEGASSPSPSGEGASSPSHSGEGASSPSPSGEGASSPSPSGEGASSPSHSGEGASSPSPSGEGASSSSPSGEGANPPSFRRGLGGGQLFRKFDKHPDGENWFEDAKQRVTDAVETGFEQLLESHRAWWSEFWSKSAIDLPDKECEKQWYLTNYIFASCSRRGAPPMPLQGVWTADDGGLPPWKGDYHSDLNTQLSYWHYMKANHLSEGRSFVDLLWNLAPQAREFARSFYDAPGICLPSVMSIEGKPLGGWVQYSICLTSQAWLCQAFDHYWLYSGDEEFLRERAYPYLKESAECIRRWLEPGSDGKLRLPLSSSPEIHDCGPRAWLTPNSNFDLALLRWIFRALERQAEHLGNGEAEEWHALLEQLPELALDANKALMLNPDESLTESHRHHSHAAAIFPLDLLDYSLPNDKAIIDATISQLDILGTGMWVGYSWPWMACLYARQGNGEAAAYHLKLFWENFCSQNGFHLNGDFKCRGLSAYHYRPFTLEGNMAAAAALQEMLLRTRGGVIRVFPAIPAEWRKKGLSFRNFRGEGGVLVSAQIDDGRLTVELQAEKDGVFRIKGDFGSGNRGYGSRIVNESPDGVTAEMKTGATLIVRAAPL